MSKVLKKDLVIKAGTVFKRIPSNTSKTFCDDSSFSNLFSLSDDSCGEIIYYIDDKDNELNEWFEDIGEEEK